MWETIITVLIVGAALFFTIRTLSRGLRKDDAEGRTSGCNGCSCALKEELNTNKRKDAGC